ncbi:MAG: hypothetical protein HQ509_08410 [Candidatus Marinimicrobia bacterium]|nr:hypothetical protein [Candidatus Neomarinimicrobiota bacterium]
MTKTLITFIFIFAAFVYSQSNVQMQGAVGAVTIDGKIYNQIALRPVIPIGKFGIALDIVLYMDEEGNIRDDDWDFSSPESGFNTLVDKIYYIRYGYPSDPLYARIGALDNVTLGYGILMSGYANTMEYPQNKKVGLDFRLKRKRYSIQAMTNDFSELGGVMGVRTTIPLRLGFPLGISFVMDKNQYYSLDDSDGDGYPDQLEGFPFDKDFWQDTDSDGIADSDPLEYDLDGDGITDTLDSRFPGWTLDTVIVLDTDITHMEEPVNILKNHNSVAAIAFDGGIPIYKDDHFDVSFYAQIAQLLGKTIDPETGGEKQLGLGIVPLGFVAKFGPAQLNIEYRKTPNGKFEFGYWNRAYELERSVFVLSNDKMTIQTKESRLGEFGPSNGLYGRLGLNLGSLLMVSVQYQSMTGDMWNPSLGDYEEIQYQNFFAETGLKKSISKLKIAKLFLQQRNVPNLFEFEPNASTVMGYRLGFEMGSGMVINYIFRKSFKDLNGDGDVTDSDEAINITAIETTFAF